jgi:hypothetical protein
VEKLVHRVNKPQKNEELQMPQAKAIYSVKKWDEKTFKEVSVEMKMTKASVEYEFVGELVGTGHTEYLMFYTYSDEKDQHKSRAEYVGLLHFHGTVAGKEGTFTLIDTGTHRDGTADSILKIVDDSGTGGLKGIRGTASYKANKDGFRFSLEYNI